eukprot:3934060-Rhodomonas_salina.7
MEGEEERSGSTIRSEEVLSAWLRQRCAGACAGASARNGGRGLVRARSARGLVGSVGFVGFHGAGVRSVGAFCRFSPPVSLALARTRNPSLSRLTVPVSFSCVCPAPPQSCSDRTGWERAAGASCSRASATSTRTLSSSAEGERLREIERVRESQRESEHERFARRLTC